MSRCVRIWKIGQVAALSKVLWRGLHLLDLSNCRPLSGGESHGVFIHFSIGPTIPYCFVTAEAGVGDQLLPHVQCCCSHREIFIWPKSLSKVGRCMMGQGGGMLFFLQLSHFIHLCNWLLWVHGFNLAAVNHPYFTRIVTLGAIKPLCSLPLNLERRKRDWKWKNPDKRSAAEKPEVRSKQGT